MRSAYAKKLSDALNGFTRSGEVRALLSELPAEQLEFLARDWQLWARDEQLPPEPDDPDAPWRVWVILGGRGAGRAFTVKL